MKHLTKNWWLHGIDYGKEERRPGWQYRKLYLNGPTTKASIAWNLFGKHGFGFGVQLGINGMESDVGLDIYLGRLLSVWLRLRSPWTRWLRLNSDRFGYHARHFAIRCFYPSRSTWFRIDCFSKEGYWSKSDPWWYEIKFGSTELWGRRRTETTVLDSGVCRIPMPEGNYIGTWEQKLYESRHVRFPGTLKDRIIPKSWTSVDLDIKGCIPVWGKGENSWDQGMDGICGTGGQTLEEAIGNATKAALRGRQRYGGPHDLDRPMSISEAESR